VVFSKLDLKKGYHQVPVNPADVQKTAVITPFGLFEYVRMPFGMQNSGQTFQRLMDRILACLEYTFVCLDDILVASRSYEEPAVHLPEVLQRLQANGLVLNDKKCLFAVPALDFLGHRVSAARIAPLEGRVAAVKNFPQPKTVRQLQSFLGMVNFYRRFIPGAAKILRPLTDALKGGQRKLVERMPEMQAVFQ
jgi:Reverse transcriptase (RNA-dependent DNA polymerase)